MRFESAGVAAFRLTSLGAINFVTARSCTSGAVSCTVTANVQAFVLSEVSVAVQWTGVAPSAKTDPLAGEQTTLTPPQPSLPTGLAKLTTALLSPVGTLVTMSDGQAIVGGVLSNTVMMARHEFVAP